MIRITRCSSANAHVTHYTLYFGFIDGRDQLTNNTCPIQVVPDS